MRIIGLLIVLAVSTVAGIMPYESALAQQSTTELERQCQQLCEEITKSYADNPARSKAIIAVVEFSDLSGGVTDFGRLLADELTTKLFATGRFTVVERLRLNKAMAEHKLQLQGLVDPKSAKEVGRVLGADAILSGTVAALGDSLRINARLYSTATGEVFSVAAVTVVKDDSVNELLTRAGGEATKPGPVGSVPSDDKTAHDKALMKATAAGTRYIGTITDTKWQDRRQRILVVFTEQNNFLVRAEVSNPDDPDAKQTFTGELLTNATPEHNGEVYPIQMSSISKDYYGGMPLESFYRSSNRSLKLRLNDTGLEGESPDGTGSSLKIRLQPGTAGPAKPSKNATKSRSGSR